MTQCWKTVLMCCALGVIGASCGDAVQEKELWLSASSRSAVVQDIRVGAIRWDAWTGDFLNQEYPNYTVGTLNEDALGPTRWRDRLPFWGRTIWQCDGPCAEVEAEMVRQEEMDQEIEYAAQALDYWAFLDYPVWRTNLEPMHHALSLYLASANKALIDFTVMLSNHTFYEYNSPTKGYIAPLHRNVIVAYWKDPQHVKVSGNRPLVYLQNPDGMAAAVWGVNKYEDIAKGDRDAAWQKLENELSALSTFAKARGLGEPYYVILKNNLDNVTDWCEQINCDAISAYALNADHINSPYPSYDFLTQSVEFRWDQFKDAADSARVGWVPTAMAGWDPRARIQHDPEHWSSYDPDNWWRTGSDVAVAGHIYNAMEQVENNPTLADAQTVLVYAWNEMTEGSWLCPVKVSKHDGVQDENDHDDGRLQALGSFRSGIRSGELIANGHFEGSVRGWTARNAASIQANSHTRHTGVSSAYVFDRGSAYGGIAQDVTAALKEVGPGNFTLGARVRLEGDDEGQARIVLQVIEPGSPDDLITNYKAIGTVSNNWDVEVGAAFNDVQWDTLKQAFVFVDTWAGETSTAANFYVDDVTLRR